MCVTEYVDRTSDAIDHRRHVLDLALDPVRLAQPARAISTPIAPYTVKRRSSAGTIGAHQPWSAAVPCTRTSGGPDPLTKQAIVVPSFDLNVRTRPAPV